MIDLTFWYSTPDDDPTGLQELEKDLGYWHIDWASITHESENKCHSIDIL
jgi:hypothetical protein